ncbi:zinc finger and BTB domain-containing protein 17-like isoform X2 [Thrips palmi]|uniref:Zinc finger and BTB domain-containing protein 17-like isoform X2 n=1 Tax=Thrips palmi TaxID=161013 RepID=A0A6P8ZV90_THRPL|nr:zinc finger and BTB domain-containing protein 17-like isoform X2 [Thrips palmi]XP_034249238.1 zinc finger and BTB domain-containing protein 17-like isoform X2 [Thrips palmi]
MSVEPDDAVQGHLASNSNNPMWSQPMAIEVDELSQRGTGISEEESMLCVQRPPSPELVSDEDWIQICDDLDPENPKREHYLEVLRSAAIELSAPESPKTEHYVDVLGSASPVGGGTSSSTDQLSPMPESPRSASPVVEILALASLLVAAQPSSPPSPVDEAMDTSAASAATDPPAEETACERPSRVGRRTRSTAKKDMTAGSKEDATARKRRGRRPAAATNKKTGQRTKRRSPVLECDLRCEQCDKKFKRRDYLRRHENLVHKNLKPKCSECGEEFSGRTILTRHMKTIHGLNAQGELLYQAKTQCDYPGCDFRTHRPADKLRAHIESVHKDKLHQVLRCRLTRGQVAPVPCKFIFFSEKCRTQHEERRTAGHTRQPEQPEQSSCNREE